MKTSCTQCDWILFRWWECWAAVDNNPPGGKQKKEKSRRPRLPRAPSEGGSWVHFLKCPEIQPNLHIPQQRPLTETKPQYSLASNDYYIHITDSFAINRHWHILQFDVSGSTPGRVFSFADPHPNKDGRPRSATQCGGESITSDKKIVSIVDNCLACWQYSGLLTIVMTGCLLYTSDAADE